MALQSIQLTFAARQVLRSLLASVVKSDTLTARTVRDIRRKLDLRQVKREIDTMLAEAKEENRGLDFDEFLDQDEGKAKKFTLDDAHIKWLVEQLTSHDWNEVPVQTKDGQETTRVPIPTGQLVAIADLADALTEPKEIK